MTVSSLCRKVFISIFLCLQQNAGLILSYGIAGTDLLSGQCCALQQPADTMMWLLSPQVPFCYKNQGLTTPLCVSFWPQNRLAVLLGAAFCCISWSARSLQVPPMTRWSRSASQIGFGAILVESTETPLIPVSISLKCPFVQRYLCDPWQYYSIARQAWK